MGYVQVVGLLLTIPLQILGNTVPLYNNPCPDILQYHMESAQSPYANISAPAPLPESNEIKLQVVISTSVPEQESGNIKLLENMSEVWRRMKSGSKQQIKYSISLPPLKSFPRIMEISMNGNIFCNDNSKPLGVLRSLGYSFRIENPRSNQIQFTEPADETFEGNLAAGEECGISTAKPHMHGLPTEEGEWPWIVAMFIKSESDGLKFQCGGTLLSRTIVLTAADCFGYKGRSVSADEIVLHLGKFNLEDPMETNSQVRNVKSVHFSGIKSVYFPGITEGIHKDADLAVIELEEPANYTRYVKPICLWKFPTDIDQIAGKFGTVVGWGNNENEEKRDIPRKTSMPVVSYDDCTWRNLDCNDDSIYFPISTYRNFCARNKNGTGQFSGDIGGGFMIPYEENNLIRWYLRGILHMRPNEKDNMECNLNNYHLYVDVAKFGDWISQFLSK